jgi:hypothetical protein
MVHFATVLSVAKAVGEKQKQFEENVLSKLDNITERDMAQQRVTIKMKMEQNKSLNDFEKWFIKQPEFYAS